jgi:hypothetical protein
MDPQSSWMTMTNSIGQLMAEGSLEVKLPTIWRDGKAEVGRVEKRREEKKREDQRRSEKRKS